MPISKISVVRSPRRPHHKRPCRASGFVQVRNCEFGLALFAPAANGLCGKLLRSKTFLRLIGTCQYSRGSGLFARRTRPLALMSSAGQVPYGFFGQTGVPDFRRGVLAGGLICAPSSRVSCYLCSSIPLCSSVVRAGVFVPGQHSPNDPCRLIGHCDSSQSGWFALEQSNCPRINPVWINLHLPQSCGHTCDE